MVLAPGPMPVPTGAEYAANESAVKKAYDALGEPVKPSGVSGLRTVLRGIGSRPNGSRAGGLAAGHALTLSFAGIGRAALSTAPIEVFIAVTILVLAC